MKRLISSLNVVFVAFLFTGCGEEPKTVEYFQANPDQAEVYKKKCDAKYEKMSIQERNEKIVKDTTCVNVIKYFKIQQANNFGGVFGKIKD